MATRTMITKLSARIEALLNARGSGRTVYVWREVGEAEESASQRHLVERPEDTSAKQVVVGWQPA